MFGTTKINNYLILTILFFVIVNYVYVVSKNIFFEEPHYAPIDYAILESKNDVIEDKKPSSDFISLANEMLNIFELHNFDRTTFLDGSYKNLIIFSSLPEDFMNLEPVQTRKDLFIKTILPIIFLENQKILKERNKILQWWIDTDGELIKRDFWPQWLKDISNKYSYDKDNIGDLLMSVDIIPISLVLSQAAIESGWGTSRYAREGNAIFGQYTFKQEIGILPKERPDTESFLVRKFQSLSDSTASYIKNLNTHNAYKEFREQRKKIRMNGQKLQGYVLSDYLKNYSERKELYIIDLKKMINDNNFSEFDEIYNSSLVD